MRYGILLLNLCVLSGCRPVPNEFSYDLSSNALASGSFDKSQIRRVEVYSSGKGKCMWMAFRDLKQTQPLISLEEEMQVMEFLNSMYTRFAPSSQPRVPQHCFQLILYSASTNASVIVQVSVSNTGATNFILRPWGDAGIYQNDNFGDYLMKLVNEAPMQQ
jgi:hypothetical protein